MAYSSSGRKELDTTSREQQQHRADLLTCLSAAGHSGCFRFWLLWLLLLWTLVYTYPWTPYSALVCVSKSGIASHDNSVWFSDICHPVFHSTAISFLRAHCQHTRVPVSSHPHQLLAFISIFDHTYPGDSEVLFYCSSVLFAHVCIFGELPLQALFPFLSWVVFMLCLRSFIFRY